jgi:hypothetical protein
MRHHRSRRSSWSRGRSLTPGTCPRSRFGNCLRLRLSRYSSNRASLKSWSILTPSLPNSAEKRRAEQLTLNECSQKANENPKKGSGRIHLRLCRSKYQAATDEGVKQPWPIRLSRGIALFQPTVLVVVLGGRDSADHAYRVIRVNR